MHKERIPYLLKQYVDNLITERELEELFSFLTNEGSSDEVRQAMEALVNLSSEDGTYQEAAWDHLYQQIMERSELAPEGNLSSPRVIPFFKRKAFVAAAAVLVCLTGAWLLWSRHPALSGENSRTAAVRSGLHDAAPGGDRATLTLADGTMIHLDSAQNGVVGRQGNEQLVKSKDAQLAYRQQGDEQRAANPSIQYNLLTTPRGGQYRLVLPDGSKVWLNAATSLRYPTSFTGQERVVELRGEAYFEIAENAVMPFKVNVLRGPAPEPHPLQITVLGTHFNVMDYEDEPTINATLLEGAIKVQKDKSGVVVRPGEQARLDKSGQLSVSAADTEEATAWKDGMFRFNGAGIEQVMRQLSRWYDVEVVYVNGIPKDRFQGEMYRNVNASKLLKVLEASGVHFTVEGNKITITHQSSLMDKAP
jgi:ferric-dicitrate binding protein FerR (iron transport regulator)